MQTTEAQIQPGWDVYGSDDQKIGTVRDVGSNYLMVEKGLIFISDLYIPFSAVESLDEGSERAYLNVAKGEVDEQSWNEPPAEDGEWEGWAARSDRQGSLDASTGRETARVPIVEEQLRATKAEQQVGQVDVRKNVVEEQQTIDVPVMREDVEVRRTRVDRPVESGDTAFESQSITVPVRGETAEVQKDARVVEEIEVSKTPREERQQVSGTVRREDVEVQATGDATVRGATSRGDGARGSMPEGGGRRLGPDRDSGEHGTEAIGGAAGAVGGAAVGGMVGGPPGAVIGGAIGAAAGAVGGEAAEGHEEAGSGAGGAAGAVGGAALGGAIAGPPGAIVGGAVGAGAGAGAGDKTQEAAEDESDDRR